MRVTHAELAAASPEERSRLMNELAETLTRRMRAADDFDAEIDRIIGELRRDGHDLWSFDADDDFQIWGPSRSDTRPGIIVDFRRGGEVTVEWPEL